MSEVLGNRITATFITNGPNGDFKSRMWRQFLPDIAIVADSHIEVHFIRSRLRDSLFPVIGAISGSLVHEQ
jgi:hypothetical protein